MPEQAKLTEKTCSKCHETLPIEYFTVDLTRKDGFRGVCKTCNRSYPEFKPDYVEKGFVPKRNLLKKTQRCARCEEVKDLAFFSRDKHTVSGYRSVCKECRKADWQKYVEKKKAEATGGAA